MGVESQWSSRQSVWVLILILYSAAVTAAADVWSALDVRTFSSVIKGGLVLGNRSVVLYDLNTTTPSGGGVVDHMWFTMGGGMAQHVVLSVYVDDEPIASIQFSPTKGLAMAGPEDNTAPWGTEFFGRTGRGHGEGLFNTRRIPFGSRLRIEGRFAIPPEIEKPQSFFFIVRGLEWINPKVPFPGVQVAGLQLPPNARLKTYTTAIEGLHALSYVTLANISTGNGGVLHEVYMHANSTEFLFMEGCFRAFVDGADEQEDRPMFLSSGTEDYFNSANYFNAGEFRLPLSG